MNLIYCLLTRCIYTFNRQLFERPSSYWYAHYLDIAFYVYFIPRMCLFSYLLLHANNKNAPLYGLFERDPLARSFSSFSLEPLLLIPFWLLLSFQVYFFWKVAQIDVSQGVWQFWRQVVIGLQDDYVSCALPRAEVEKRQQIKAKAILKNLVRYSFLWRRLYQNVRSRRILMSAIRFSARLQLWAQLEDINRRRFSQVGRISELPSLSRDVKRRVLLALTTLDVLFCAQQLFIAILAIFTFTSLVQSSSHFLFCSFLSTLWVIIDLSLYTYTCFRLVHHASLFYANIFLVVYLLGGHSAALQSSLSSLIPSKEYVRKYSCALKEATTGRFLLDHNTLTRLTVLLNRRLWGNVLAAFVLTNLPVYAYAQGRLLILFTDYSDSIALVERNLLLATFFLQTVAFQTALWPLMYFSQRMHAPQRTIVSLQQYLTGRALLRAKLKLDDLKCRLSCGQPKITFTIVPSKEITHESLIELVCFYFGFFFLVIQKLV